MTWIRINGKLSINLEEQANITVVTDFKLNYDAIGRTSTATDAAGNEIIDGYTVVTGPTGKTIMATFIQPDAKGQLDSFMDFVFAEIAKGSLVIDIRKYNPAE